MKFNGYFISNVGTKFFMIRILKVKRIQKTDKSFSGLATICKDLEDMLIKLGLEEKKHTDEKIIDPNEEFALSSII